MYNVKNDLTQTGYRLSLPDEYLLTSPKLFPAVYFHNLPEEHALHNANSFSGSQCPIIQKTK